MFPVENEVSEVFTGLRLIMLSSHSAMQPEQLAWCLQQPGRGLQVPSCAMTPCFGEQHLLWQPWRGRCQLSCMGLLIPACEGGKDQLKGYRDMLSQWWHPGRLCSVCVKVGGFFSAESVGPKGEGRAYRVGLGCSSIKLERNCSSG